MILRAVAIVPGLALLAAAAPARAQTPAPGFDKVIASVTLDFNGDAKKDRALLVDNGDGDADLIIYLGVDDPKAGRDIMKPAATKKAIVNAGPIWGQEPSLAVNGKNSLIIKSQNLAIGRLRWERSLTLVYRNGEFLIIGFTYEARDGLDPKGGGFCDINLATGKGTRDNKPVSMPPAPVRLADWSEEKTPKNCSF